jgi:hypothetical protein
VVDVRNDAEVADVLGIHGLFSGGAAPAAAMQAAWSAPTTRFKLPSLPYIAQKSKSGGCRSKRVEDRGEDGWARRRARPARTCVDLKTRTAFVLCELKAISNRPNCRLEKAGNGNSKMETRRLRTEPARKTP